MGRGEGGNEPRGNLSTVGSEKLLEWSRRDYFGRTPKGCTKHSGGEEMGVSKVKFGMLDGMICEAMSEKGSIKYNVGSALYLVRLANREKGWDNIHPVF